MQPYFFTIISLHIRIFCRSISSSVRVILFLHVDPCRQNVHEAATDHVVFLATGETKLQKQEWGAV